MTREAFFTWLHAIDFTTIPTAATQPPSKGLMEVEIPQSAKK